MWWNSTCKEMGFRQCTRGLLLFLFLVGGCAGRAEEFPTPRPAVRLRVAAVTAGQPYLREWLTLYQARHPETIVEIVPAGPGQAQEMLARGKVALALLDQEPEERYRGILTATRVAYVPLAVVVHPDNPLRDLSSAAVAEIFRGRVADWSLVGGEERPLQIHLLPDSSGAVQAFARQALAGRPLSPQARVHASPTLLRQALAQDPGGIGFLPAMEATDGVAVLRIDGRPPSEGEYPWKMPLYLLWGPRSPSEAFSFLLFLSRFSPIQRSGFNSGPRPDSPAGLGRSSTRARQIWMAPQRRQVTQISSLRLGRV